MALELTEDMRALIARTPLRYGSHSSFADGACAMELASYIAGEPWSDHSGCVCPVIGAFVRSWNDDLPDDERNRLLKPILPRLIGTRGSDALAELRALMAADWLVRVHAPAWLRLAKLEATASALETLPEIIDRAQIPSIRARLETARRDTAAAWDAARAAAWDAAWPAARDVARSAARAAAWAAARAAAGSAAWPAARDVARDAARAAAWAAARAAAKARLEPTQDKLMASAAELLNRMIDAQAALGVAGDV